MAGISETISLVDGTSAVLIRIANAADGMTVSVDKAKGAIDSMRASSERTSSVLGQMKSAFSGMLGTFALGNMAADVAMRIAEREIGRVVRHRIGFRNYIETYIRKAEIRIYHSCFGYASQRILFSLCCKRIYCVVQFHVGVKRIIFRLHPLFAVRII